jgi:hypothetical protein
LCSTTISSLFRRRHIFGKMSFSAAVFLPSSFVV